jgi:hypothetical protein
MPGNPSTAVAPLPPGFCLHVLVTESTISVDFIEILNTICNLYISFNYLYKIALCR